MGLIRTRAARSSFVGRRDDFQTHVLTPQIRRPDLDYLVFRSVLLKRECGKEHELRGRMRSTGQGAQGVQTRVLQPPHPLPLGCSLSPLPKQYVSCPELWFCFKLIILKQKLYDANDSRGFVRASVICSPKEQPVWVTCPGFSGACPTTSLKESTEISNKI